MNSDVRQPIISEVLNDSRTHVLPKDPKPSDLFRYSQICLRKRRARKKFGKRLWRYVPSHIWIEYIAKLMIRPLFRSTNYDEIGKKLFMIEQLPQGVLPCYPR